MRLTDGRTDRQKVDSIRIRTVKMTLHQLTSRHIDTDVLLTTHTPPGSTQLDSTNCLYVCTT